MAAAWTRKGALREKGSLWRVISALFCSNSLRDSEVLAVFGLYFCSSVPKAGQGLTTSPRPPPPGSMGLQNEALPSGLVPPPGLLSPFSKQCAQGALNELPELSQATDTRELACQK